MRIGELSQRSGVSVKTIRYYEHVGILERAEREPNGYRTYGPPALDRLAFTRSAQAIGLTLGEIREIIEFRDQGRAPCQHVLVLLDQHSVELDEHIERLTTLRTELRRLARRGRKLDPNACPATSICHVIPPRP